MFSTNSNQNFHVKAWTWSCPLITETCCGIGTDLEDVVMSYGREQLDVAIYPQLHVNLHAWIQRKVGVDHAAGKGAHA